MVGDREENNICDLLITLMQLSIWGGGVKTRENDSLDDSIGVKLFEDEISSGGHFLLGIPLKILQRLM